MDKNRKFNPQVAEVAKKLIGEHFRARREELGLTQGDLAACAGLRQYQISSFEQGQGNITINNLLAIGGCLRMKIFFEEADPQSPPGDPFNADKPNLN